ncbi:MAG: alanine--tRNA ligase [Bacteroidales bacterium]|jgi:alanyl-tRNA synthetase|nr:alanine--tRNA ligase [Bacteroidales bacterium]
MTSNELRKSFLDFFKSKQHHIVPSAPMVVKNDPTLMFTNAGMNQFKDIFLGNNPAVYSRVADSQKCLRVSGKHNDLEEVGHDTYHHTMFEMLGNWSFGDYFKKDAIAWAWEYLTEVLNIDKNRLYATVCEASPEDGFDMDKEAFDLWKQYLPEDRILIGKKKDNFWEMGETGPCGPCSEIHYDSRPDDERAKVPGHERVNADDPQVIEIWNLVFIQYNRKASGELELLPAKHVDTGMGFERLCRIVQGKTSNYDIDLFQDIIKDISMMCGIPYGKHEQSDIAMRVVADHIRAISFSIADGQIPSNNKAGYVIRRLLRRAVRYGYTFLGRTEPFLCELVPALVCVMGDSFPELKAQQKLIEHVIREEEQSFLRTLSTGISLLENIIAEAGAKQQTVISGKVVFEMYDTYGFPLDLTELILRENRLSYNEAEYEAEMTAQKNRSRVAAAVDTGDWVELVSGDETRFIGYDYTEADVHITRYRKVTAKGREQYQLVFDVTPFYAESGGQVGDMGCIKSETECIPVLNTKKENNLNIHMVDRLPEHMDADFLAVVDTGKRRATEANHSATHLLHHALRETLGMHVEQKGSLVGPDYLRFDFSHFQKMSDEEIRAVEERVNRMIRENAPLNEYRGIPIDEARKMGAMALFGEKYGEEVRAIRFGDSIELCGGTHVKATGQIGIFMIISESAIAAGIRRIEAITAEKAEQYIRAQEDTIRQIRSMFNNSPLFLQAIRKTVEENNELKKQLEDVMRKRMAEFQHGLVESAEEHNGIRVIRFTSSFAPDLIKDMAFKLKNRFERIVFIAGSDFGGKPTLTIALSDVLVAEGKNAANAVREAAREMQGGGGGQPFFATAGGKNVSGLEKAMEKAFQLLVG